MARRDGLRASFLSALNVMGALCALVLPGCGETTVGALPPSAPSVIQGGPMPPFEGSALGGTRFASYEFKGRVIVVAFFNQYCDPCRETLPILQGFNVRNDEVQVIGIATDATPKPALATIEQYHLTFPVVHDLDHSLAGLFRVLDVPTTFVIDGAGNVAWVSRPEANLQDLWTAIESVRPAARVLRTPQATPPQTPSPGEPAPLPPAAPSAPPVAPPPSPPSPPPPSPPPAPSVNPNESPLVPLKPIPPPPAPPAMPQ